jgi:hypothetical protein
MYIQAPVALTAEHLSTPTGAGDCLNVVHNTRLLRDVCVQC